MGKNSRDKEDDLDDELTDLEEKIRLKQLEMEMKEQAFKREREMKLFVDKNQQMLQQQILKEARDAKITAEATRKTAEETATKLSNLQMQLEEMKKEQARQAETPPKTSWGSWFGWS